jgi:hypothetical protein
MRIISNELDIGENYTRGELCDLMHYSWKESINDIYCGIYKPSSYSSVFLFSTINNPFGYRNFSLNDNNFVFSGRNIDIYNYDIEAKLPKLMGNTDDVLTMHKLLNNELLLFIRLTAETGFYYFGKAEFINSYSIKKYYHPIYHIQLLETTFSAQSKKIELPSL